LRTGVSAGDHGIVNTHNDEDNDGNLECPQEQIHPGEAINELSKHTDFLLLIRGFVKGEPKNVYSLAHPRLLSVSYMPCAVEQRNELS
jgi:hypothetical protein